MALGECDCAWRRGDDAIINPPPTPPPRPAERPLPLLPALLLRLIARFRCCVREVRFMCKMRFMSKMRFMCKFRFMCKMRFMCRVRGPEEKEGRRTYTQPHICPFTNTPRDRCDPTHTFPPTHLPDLPTHLCAPLGRERCDPKATLVVGRWVLGVGWW